MVKINNNILTKRIKIFIHLIFVSVVDPGNVVVEVVLGGEHVAADPAGVLVVAGEVDVFHMLLQVASVGSCLAAHST